VLVAAAVLVFALFGAFAYEFLHSQAVSRRQAEQSFGAQARITSELTSSLFASSVAGAEAQAAKDFGAERVPSRSALAASAKRSHLLYAVILDGRGRVLAASAGAPRTDGRGRAVASDQVGRALAGQAWLSDLMIDGRRHAVMEWALPFQTRYGRRVEIEAFDARVLSGFFSGYLKAPKGETARAGFIVDDNDRVVADSSGAVELGSRLTGKIAQVQGGGRFSSGGTERYAVAAPLAGSDWRVLLSERTSKLFPALAGSMSWILDGALVAFALVAFVGLLLLRRMLGSAASVEAANRRLGELNETLEQQVAERTRLAEQRAEELARSNNELEQFASVASHDLQEPLRKIRMYCGRLPQRLGDALPEPAASDLDRIQGAAERMQRLIDDLLSLARVGSRQHAFEPVDLAELTREVVGDLEARIEELQARVEINELPVVAADRAQMSQLLLNLIGNALKFHRADVPPLVRINSQPLPEQPARFGADAGVGRRCLITVEDNGIGFDPKYAERVFSAFERLHSRSDYEGTGIGLSIARKIARRHGGELTAASAPGEGSVFTVTLPLLAAASGLAEEAA
jgi:signal transduction histidine kinase